jgi:hypothetical protein
MRYQSPAQANPIILNVRIRIAKHLKGRCRILAACHMMPSSTLDTRTGSEGSDKVWRSTIITHLCLVVLGRQIGIHGAAAKAEKPQHLSGELGQVELGGSRE